MAELRRCKGTWAFCDGYCEKCNTTATTRIPTMYLMPPTADVVERKVGKWIEEVGMLMCSECGDSWGTEQFDEVMSFNYCPNCGAEMKGEDDG